MLAGHALPGYRIAPYPVPNTIVALMLALLDLATSPETAGKLVITLAIALFIAGSLYLLTALNRSERNPLLLVPLVFVFNYFLLRGELAYLLGLGGFFLYAGYLIRTLPSPERASPGLILIASCALFFTHIAAFAAAGLMSIAAVSANPRRKVFARLIVPLIPSGLLLTWSFIGQKLQNGPAAGAEWRFWTLHQLAGAIVAAFSPFQGFLPWIAFDGPAPHAAAILNAVVCVAIVATIVVASCAAFRARETVDFSVRLAALFCAVAAIATGYAYGVFISPGERFLIPAAWLAFCWIGFAVRDRRSDRAARAASVALLMLLIAQGLYYNLACSMVSAGLKDQYQALRGASTGDDFRRICQKGFDASWPRPHRPTLEAMFPTHAPLVRAPYYIYIEQAAAASINPVGPVVKLANGDYTNTCAEAAFVPHATSGN